MIDVQGHFEGRAVHRACRNLREARAFVRIFERDGAAAVKIIVFDGGRYRIVQ